jgi:hypothetical protein
MRSRSVERSAIGTRNELTIASGEITTLDHESVDVGQI